MSDHHTPGASEGPKQQVPLSKYNPDTDGLTRVDTRETSPGETQRAVPATASPPQTDKPLPPPPREPQSERDAASGTDPHSSLLPPIESSSDTAPSETGPDRDTKRSSAGSATEWAQRKAREPGYGDVGTFVSVIARGGKRTTLHAPSRKEAESAKTTTGKSEQQEQNTSDYKPDW